jgi:hypothetical protein
MTRIGELGTLAVTSNLLTLRGNTKYQEILRLSISWYLVFPRSVSRLLVTAYVVPSSPILVTLMMQVLRSSETSVLTITIWRNIYIALTTCAL